MSNDWVEQAYRDYELNITKFLLLKLPYAEVEDAVAEVFEIAIRKRLTPDNSQAWLIGIAKKVALRRQKARQVEESRLHSMDEVTESGLGSMVDEELGLLAAIDALSADERELITLCYLVKVERDDLARSLGITRGALDVRVHRAKRRLLEILNAGAKEDANV